MDRMTRLARLCRLVEEANGRVDGRKKLHKLVYLCERSGFDLDQSFVFHYYGVYSPSLAADLETAKSWGVLREESHGDGYVIALGDVRINPQEAEDGSGPVDLSIVRDLAPETAMTLEVLSTILYLYDNGYRDTQLEEKLTSLKGHLRVAFPRAYELAGEHFQVGLGEPGRRCRVVRE